MHRKLPIMDVDVPLFSQRYLTVVYLTAAGKGYHTRGRRMKFLVGQENRFSVIFFILYPDIIYVLFLQNPELQWICKIKRSIQ